MAKPKHSPTDEELLALGKKLQQFYDSGYVNKKASVWFSFLKGLAAGFGAFLGGTILIGLLLWVLSYFQQFPLLTHFTELIQQGLTK